VLPRQPPAAPRGAPDGAGRRKVTCATPTYSDVRRHLQGDGVDPKPIPQTDGELLQRHLLRVTLNAKELTLRLRADVAGNDPAADQHELLPRSGNKNRYSVGTSTTNASNSGAGTRLVGPGECFRTAACET
jgi:hypothetical protein